MAKTMSREMTALCTQLTQWRQGDGGRGKRIPESLWSQAAAVARVDGVDETARATRLDGARLRARMQPDQPATGDVTVKMVSAARRADEAHPTSTRFVSVQLPAAPRSHAISIELYGKAGERMRIESASALDLCGVVQAFWSRQS